MKYRDEIDKCYGVAGMALGLSLFNADDKFTGITIDGEDGFDCINFTPEYYLFYNPSLPAKTAWRNMLNNFHLSMALTMADGICRHVVGDHKEIDHILRHKLYKLSCEEGKALCQLEADEIDDVFNEYFSYLSQVFSNKTVRRVVKTIRDELINSRSIDRLDLLDMLAPLRH